MAFEGHRSIHSVILERLFGNGLGAEVPTGKDSVAVTESLRGRSASPASAPSPPQDGLAAGDHGGTEITGAEEVPHEPVASVPARTPSAPAASQLTADGRKKRCSREARHHINHGGNPCPVCGYPKGGE